MNDSANELDNLYAIENDLYQQQQRFSSQLQKILHEIEGMSCGSFEANAALARRIQSIMQQIHVRVKCPKTGIPGSLRHRKGGSAKFGTFQIEIIESDKRTSRFSSTTFPKLEVVPAPKDKRKKD